MVSPNHRSSVAQIVQNFISTAETGGSEPLIWSPSQLPHASVAGPHDCRKAREKAPLVFAFSKHNGSASSTTPMVDPVVVTGTTPQIQPPRPGRVRPIVGTGAKSPTPATSPKRTI